MPPKERKSRWRRAEKERIEAIRKRYLRKIVNKDSIHHHGDCHFWEAKICTCGLLHDLIVLDDPEKLYRRVFAEHAAHEKRFYEAGRRPCN